MLKSVFNPENTLRKECSSLSKTLKEDTSRSHKNNHQLKLTSKEEMRLITKAAMWSVIIFILVKKVKKQL